MADPLTPAERSALMAKVRGVGSRSTEERVRLYLVDAGVSGWVSHPSGILGRPDFYFPELRLAVFIDGCFWHGCPKCKRNTPRTRAEFWSKKIAENRRRDGRVTRKLRGEGAHVIRIWEHELSDTWWQSRLKRMFTRLRPS